MKLLDFWHKAPNVTTCREFPYFFIFLLLYNYKGLFTAHHMVLVEEDRGRMLASRSGMIYRKKNRRPQSYCAAQENIFLSGQP